MMRSWRTKPLRLLPLQTMRSIRTTSRQNRSNSSAMVGSSWQATTTTGTGGAWVPAECNISNDTCVYIAESGDKSRNRRRSTGRSRRRSKQHKFKHQAKSYRVQRKQMDCVLTLLITMHILHIHILHIAPVGRKHKQSSNKARFSKKMLFWSSATVLEFGMIHVGDSYRMRCDSYCMRLVLIVKNSNSDRLGINCRADLHSSSSSSSIFPSLMRFRFHNSNINSAPG
jgi:hypothetical protein